MFEKDCRTEMRQMIAKPGLTPKKIILYLVRLEKSRPLLPSGKTIDSDFYYQQLVIERVKQSIQKKRPELINRKDIVFHYNNARPHTILPTTRQKMKELDWEILIHLTLHCQTIQTICFGFCRTLLSRE